MATEVKSICGGRSEYSFIIYYLFGKSKINELDGWWDSTQKQMDEISLPMSFKKSYAGD